MAIEHASCESLDSCQFRTAVSVFNRVVGIVLCHLNKGVLCLLVEAQNVAEEEGSCSSCEFSTQIEQSEHDLNLRI